MVAVRGRCAQLRWRTGFVASLAAALAFGVLGVVGSAGTAGAQGSVPYSEVPIVGAGVDGPVWASELIGSELWIGGDFRTARDYDAASPSLETSGIAVIDINTGELVPRRFSTDGPVYGIEYSDGVIWIVGNFDHFDGSPARNIVSLDARTGQRRSNFVADSNAQLRDAVVHQGWLYLGGNSSLYNGSPVAKLFRVDPVTGALDASWNPEVQLFVESVDAAGGLVIAAERAEDYRAEVKVIDIATAQRVAGLDPVSDERRGTGMWDAEFSADGTSVYTAETGNSVGKFTTDDRRLWASPRSEGDMQAVAATDDYVFAGFHEGWNGNRNRHVVAFDADTGDLDRSWNVETNEFWGVRDIEIYDQGLVIAGAFTAANGVQARRLAIFRPTGSWPLAEPLDRIAPGDVSCDDTTDVVDAMYVAQYSVGNRRAAPSCVDFDTNRDIRADRADVDRNGVVDVVDAMLIAQCSVGNPNVFCPVE